MKQIKTERGFDLVEFEDSNEVECSLQKSSVATDDLVWLGCSTIGLKRFAPGGWIDVDLDDGSYIANTRIHLSRDQVAELLPILTRFVETGNLV